MPCPRVQVAKDMHEQAQFKDRIGKEGRKPLARFWLLSSRRKMNNTLQLRQPGMPEPSKVERIDKFQKLEGPSF